MIRLKLFASFLVLSSTLLAQTVDSEFLKSLGIRSIGPAGMSGRVTSIDVVHKQPQTIYVGTASGGVWRSKSGGISWEPLFDEQPLQSIGAVAIDQSNPSIIWAGTGEGNPRNSHNSGAGIYKSLDAGKTWKLMGLEATRTIHRIIIDPTNSNTIYVAALGSAWGNNEERGVFKTTDGGQTWSKILYKGPQTGCADLVIDPQNPQKLIAAMWQHHRDPWFFNSGGPNSGLYLTYDGGATWKQITAKNGLPKGELGRIGLAIAPSSPNVVYALVESKTTGLYRSTNGGEDFTLQSTKNIGNRPFYYADIFVDPKNENRLYNLYSLVSLSEDAGKTFRVLLPYSGVHPDHHAFWVHPENPNYIIEGNDGGLNISHDRGENWRFIENLPIGQFYHINVDNQVPFNIYGGMQDNGSWVGPGYVFQQGGLRNSHWNEVLFGDGFDVMPDLSNPGWCYAMYQGGHLYHVNQTTGESTFIQPTAHDSTALRFNWNAALASDPHNSKGLYFGSQFLHYSANNGASWQVLSPDLTTNDSTKQKQAQSGGLTIDATQAENFTTITTIAPSPINKAVIWVGTDDGNLQLTTNSGSTWTNLAAKLPNLPAGSYFAQIHASQYNEGEAFVVANNYRRNDWKTYIYHTTDFGKKFTLLINPEVVKGYALSVIQDVENPNLLFVGTDRGLHFSMDKGVNWQKWSSDFPSVPTSDLAIQAEHKSLVLGTFGRAAWVLDDLQPLRDLCSNQKLLADSFLIFQPNTAYLAEYKSADGVRFTANAHFEGKNKPRGARLGVWVHPKKKEQLAKKEPKKREYPASDKFWVYVLNAQNDTIRTFETKADTGFQYINWNLTVDGAHTPNYTEHKKGEPYFNPSGMRVAPGNYRILVQYGPEIQRTTLTVAADPRIEFNAKVYAEKMAFYNEWKTLANKLTNQIEELKYWQKEVALVQQVVEHNQVNDSVAKAFKTITDTLNKSVNQLFEQVLLPKDFEGYDHVTVRLSDRLYELNQFIQDYTGINLQAIERTKADLIKAMGNFSTQYSEVYQNQWVAFENFVRNEQLKLLVERE